MSSQLYPIATQSGLQAAVSGEETMLSLKTMVEKDTAIIADSSATMQQKLTAFQELSGWTNGTDPKWNVLDDSYFATQKATLNTNLQTCLKNFNDVEIPVGDGNFARVYNADGSPATAADFLNAWTQSNSATGTGVNFNFSYEANCDNSQSFVHSSQGNQTPPWSNEDNNDMQGGCSANQTHDTNSDPSKNIHVDAHQHSCSNESSFNCSGDAQAIAGYCDYQHMDANGNDVSYNYQSDFTGTDGALTNCGWA